MTCCKLQAIVVGWGTIYFGGPTSDTLQEVNVRVWDNQECANNYQQLGRTVLDTMLCAGETNRDSCQGDSGGPLNCLVNNKWELCGVVSWGAKCAEPGKPDTIIAIILNFSSLQIFLAYIRELQSTLIGLIIILFKCELNFDQIFCGNRIESHKKLT